jgi:hypothetical protein
MDDGWWIVCGALVLVLFLNLGIVVAFVGRRGKEQAARWGKAMRSLANPWREEEESLAELHRLARNFNAEERGEPYDES